MKNNTNKSWLIIILLVLGGLYYFNQNNSTKTVYEGSQVMTPTIGIVKSAQNKVEASLDILNALSYYELAGQNTNTHQDQDVLTQAITTLLKQNDYMKDGNSSVQKYVNDPNQVISLSAEGMTLGANKVIKANNDFIAYLRKIDYNDPNYEENLSYAVAKHNTDRDSGFKTIFISAPNCLSLL